MPSWSCRCPARLQLDRRVVGEDRRSAQDVAPDRVGQWLQQRRRLADPVRQRRSVEVDALTLEDPALPVERQMIAIFGDQDMGEQAGPGASPLDRARRQGRLADGLAAGAGQARAHDPVHHEPPRHVVELFGDVLAQRLQPAAALSAGIAGRDQGLLARKVRRQRLALRHPLRRGSRVGRRHGPAGLSRRDRLVLHPAGAGAGRGSRRSTRTDRGEGRRADARAWRSAAPGTSPARPDPRRPPARSSAGSLGSAWVWSNMTVDSRTARPGESPAHLKC